MLVSRRLTDGRCLHQMLMSQRAFVTDLLDGSPLGVGSLQDLLLGHHGADLDSQTTAVKKFSDMPGPIGLPLIGNAFKYSKLGPYKFEKILHNRFSYLKKYGKIYKEKLGTMQIVHLFDPSDIAAMFRFEGKYPSRGTIANLELTYLKRNNKLLGFAFIDGPEWARQRSVIQKLMMHPAATQPYLPAQVPVAEDFVDYLRNKRTDDGVVPDFYDDIFKFTMEAIGVVCFDKRLGTFTSSATCDAGQLSQAIKETFFCFRNCMFCFPWYQYFRTPMYRRFEKAANKMREIMEVHVKEIREQVMANRLTGGEPNGHGVCPIATSLIHDSDKSVYESLAKDTRVCKELASNIIMAQFRTGIDSTANAMAFFLYNLANNPDKQAILYNEIETALPNGAPLTYKILANMPYLKACLRESFRLHFPVFGGSGRVMPKDMTFSGYNVPKGTFIFANMAAMSRMEEYFPRPEEYHPERWLRDDRGDMQTTWRKDPGFLSLPFSHGMRACPGKRFAEQALYLAVTTILQNFRLEYHKEPIGMIHMPFTVPDKPLDINFVPR